MAAYTAAPSISQAVEDLVVATLIDPENGLLATMDAMVQPGSPWENVSVPDLDLTDDGSHQLLRAWVSLDDYLNTTSEQLPIVFVHVNRTEDQHAVLGSDFSGLVSAGIDILLSSESEMIDPLLQAQGNLTDDAMRRIFGISSRLQTPNPLGTIRKVGLNCIRTPQRRAGNGWVMPMMYTLPLQVYSQPY